MKDQELLQIEELRRLCKMRAINWSKHGLSRIQIRGINPSDVKNCIYTGHIIEQYPNDYPFPSCLVLGSAINGSALHVVVAVGDGVLWIITAYYPDQDRWDDIFSIRRSK